MKKILFLILLAFSCSGCYSSGTGYSYRRQPTTYNINVRDYNQRLPEEIYDPNAGWKAFGDAFLRSFYGNK